MIDLQKRYLMFAYNRHHPEGGFIDFICSFDNKKELNEMLKKLKEVDSNALQVFAKKSLYQVVDTSEDTIHEATSANIIVNCLEGTASLTEELVEEFEYRTYYNPNIFKEIL